MTDVYPPEKRSAVMRRVKGKDTTPELFVRRLIWGLGGRYRLHRANLPGKPDIVLPGRRLAVFVHGCFWHGHTCARGARVPKANRDYWLAKVGRNRARDAASRTALEAAGWRVETIWECDLKDRAALEARVRGWLALASPISAVIPQASAASCSGSTSHGALSRSRTTPLRGSPG